jgi:hypothetical protein
MGDLIYTFGAPYRASDGRGFQVQVRGAPRRHVWHGWLAFLPLDGAPELVTDHETTQPNRDALAYWASGLEALYLDGAFERTSRRRRRLGERLLAQAAAIVDRRWSQGES